MFGRMGKRVDDLFWEVRVDGEMGRWPVLGGPGGWGNGARTRSWSPN